MSLATGRDQLERMFSFAAASDLEINIPDGTETSGIYHNSISCSRTLVAEGVGTSTEQSAGGAGRPAGDCMARELSGPAGHFSPTGFERVSIRFHDRPSSAGAAACHAGLLAWSSQQHMPQLPAWHCGVHLTPALGGHHYCPPFTHEGGSVNRPSPLCMLRCTPRTARQQNLAAFSSSVSLPKATQRCDIRLKRKIKIINCK